MREERSNDEILLSLCKIVFENIPDELYQVTTIHADTLELIDAVRFDFEEDALAYAYSMLSNWEVLH